jgi:putative endonuclease
MSASDNPTTGFHYVYILTSQSESNRHYIGRTGNLAGRLKAHNQGRVAHTSKHRPWQVETALAFRNKEKAIAFEKYLKTHSGRAFATKRL